MHAELQTTGIGGADKRLAGRHLLHAVVPESQTLQAAALHAVFHGLTGLRGLERVHGVDILEYERQVKQAELLGEFFELRQRRRGKLDVALQHRLKHFVVVVKRRVWEDFHASLAVHFLVHALLQQGGCNAFGVLVGVGHMAEFDDHLAIVTRGHGDTGHKGNCGDTSRLHKGFHWFPPEKRC